MVRAVMKKLVFFYYNDGSRSQQTVGTLLKSFPGYLQSDGWQAYNVFDKEDQVCLVGCMVHIRRYYEKALNENKALAEHAIRPIALSRKNFMFCGNHEAAGNTAIICSLLTSCKEQGVNPREWLIDVIGKMPYYQKPGNDENLKKLLPNYWKNKGN